LPAYDEFLISYRDRSASLSLTSNKKTVSVNGIFYPVIVVDGQVSGVWRRSVKNGKVTIELTEYFKLDKSRRELIEQKAYTVGKFLNKETEIRYFQFNTPYKIQTSGIKQ
jgi:hypothetical protein